MAAILLSIATLAAAAVGVDALVRRSKSPLLRRMFNHVFLVSVASGALGGDCVRRYRALQSGPGSCGWRRWRASASRSVGRSWRIDRARCEDLRLGSRRPSP